MTSSQNIKKYKYYSFGGIDKETPEFEEINVEDDSEINTLSDRLLYSIKGYIPIGGMQSFGPLAVPVTNTIALRIKSSNETRIQIDTNSDIVTVDSYVTIEELLKFLISHDRTLFVAPGTGMATIGGCVASDVHGKNAHFWGSFGDHIISLTILDAVNGVVKEISCKDNDFKWTIGGLGVTGLIINVRLKVRKLPSKFLILSNKKYTNIEKFLTDFISQAENVEDLGAWFSISGKNFYSKIFSAHWTNKAAENLSLKVPNFFLNHFFYIGGLSLWRKIFHQLIIKIIFFTAIREQVLRIEEILFPLNKVKSLKLIFGSALIERQFLIPTKDSTMVLYNLLDICNQCNIILPFCGMKIFKGSRIGYMSFANEGISISIQYSSDEIYFDQKITNYLIKNNYPEYLAKSQKLTTSFPGGYPNHKLWIRLLQKNQIKSKLLNWLTK